MDLEDWSWYWTSTSPTTPTHPRASSVGVERFFTNESSGSLPVPQWATASKKKRKRKPKKTFATFIFKVLEEVHPDTEVSSVCPLVREDCSRGQHICKLDQYSSKNNEKSPWPIGPRTLGPQTLSPWHLKSLGPRGQGPEIRGALGPQPLGPWDLMCQGLRVRGPMGQGLIALEPR